MAWLRLGCAGLAWPWLAWPHCLGGALTSWAGLGWLGQAWTGLAGNLSVNKGLAGWGWLGDGLRCLGRLKLVLAWARLALAWLAWLAGLAGLGWFGLVWACSRYRNQKMIQNPLSSCPHKTVNYLWLLMIQADWGASENQQNINNK